MDDCDCENCTACTPRGKLDCPDCGGALEKGQSDLAEHRDGRVLLIRHIPSEVCNQCGAFLLDSGVLGFVEAQFQRFLAEDPRALCGVANYEESGTNAKA